MNIKGFRRMLFGEKMPDKNDPKYKDYCSYIMSIAIGYLATSHQP